MIPFSRRQALAEAERCLQCFDAPCVRACPTHIDIPGFIAMLLSGNVRGAAGRVRAANALAGSCGRICPEEVFCQSVCTRRHLDRPIRIRELHLQATASVPAPLRPRHPDGSPDVAVIGAGPAGLGCAVELVRLGHAPCVFDPGTAGGVPGDSIPPFRLPDETLQDDLAHLPPSLRFEPAHVDADLFDRIRRDFAAVFVACGLGHDRRLGIPGEDLPGALPVLTFLREARRNPTMASPGRTVIVVGGGNVSLDAAATARRLGAERVVLLYRRTEREMRVWAGELDEARRQGVELQFLAAPVTILGVDRVEAVRCRRMALTAHHDPDGRRQVEPVIGSEFTIAAEAIITAIGQEIRAPFADRLERTTGGQLRIDASFRTSLPGVYAGGDAVHGEGTVVQSLAHGRDAARAIHADLEGARR